MWAHSTSISIVLLCQSEEVYKILKETGTGDFVFIVFVNIA